MMSRESEKNTGRPRHIVRSMFSEDSSGQWHCLFCCSLVSNRVQSLQSHLKKCNPFKDKNHLAWAEDGQWLLNPKHFMLTSRGSVITDTVKAKWKSLVDKFGFRKKREDFEFNNRSNLTSEDFFNEIFPLSVVRQERMRQSFVDVLSFHNLPFTLAESRVFHEFVRSINPCADVFLPSSAACRKILLRQVDDGKLLIKKIGNESKVNDYTVSVAVDSWTSVSNESILGLVMTCGKLTYPDSVNLGLRSETGSELARIMESWIIDNNNYLNVHGAEIGCVVTDDAANCVKARRILALRFPNICFRKCLAHQVNLIVKDTLTILGLDKVDLLKDAVTTIRRSKKLLGMFQRLCVNLYGNANVYSLKPLVKVRWNTAHQCLCSFLRVRGVWESFSEIAAVVTKKRGKEEQPSVFQRLLVELKEDYLSFCINLEKILRPLVRFSLCMQRKVESLAVAFSHLLEVYGSFSQHESEEMREKLTSRLEARWESYEQPLFLLSYHLHPRYHSSSLLLHRDLNDQGVIEDSLILLRRFCQLYFKKFIPARVSEEQVIADAHPVIFGKLEQRIQKYANDSDPIDCWDVLRAKAPLTSRLAKFLLTLSINSASCERLFSLYGIIKSSRRNQLAPELMRDLALRRKCIELQEWSSKATENSLVMCPDEYSKAQPEREDCTAGSEIDSQVLSVADFAEEGIDEIALDLEHISLEESWKNFKELAEPEPIRQDSLNGNQLCSTEAEGTAFEAGKFRGEVYRRTHGPISPQSEQEILKGDRAFKIRLKEIYTSWISAKNSHTVAL